MSAPQQSAFANPYATSMTMAPPGMTPHPLALSPPRIPHLPLVSSVARVIFPGIRPYLTSCTHPTLCFFFPSPSRFFCRWFPLFLLRTDLVSFPVKRPPNCPSTWVLTTPFEIVPCRPPVPPTRAPDRSAQPPPIHSWTIPTPCRPSPPPLVSPRSPPSTGPT